MSSQTWPTTGTNCSRTGSTAGEGPSCLQVLQNLYCVNQCFTKARLTALTEDPGVGAAYTHAGSFDTVHPCHCFQAVTLRTPLHPQSLYHAGDWNFDHTMQQIPLDGLPTRLTSTTDCSSNNSGDVAPVKQVGPFFPPYLVALL